MEKNGKIEGNCYMRCMADLCKAVVQNDFRGGIVYGMQWKLL